MAKIYALALVSISEMRDSKIDSLFSDEPETFSGNWEYIWQNNSNLSKYIDFKSKIYKTLSGALRSANLLTKNNHGRKIRLCQGVVDPKGMWINSINFDTSTHKLALLVPLLPAFLFYYPLHLQRRYYPRMKQYKPFLPPWYLNTSR